MAHDLKSLSRRNFVKVLAATAGLPLLPGSSSAQDSTTATATAIQPASGDIHRIVTANILATLSEHDDQPIDWETRRKDVCIKVLKDQKADIICFQEVLRSQYEDFRAAFPEFQAYGYEGPLMDTNPPRFTGAKNLIMFSRDRYRLTSAGHFWFSEKPLIEGSNAWGERLGRHLNWVRLEDEKTQKQFRVINTHFSVRNAEHQLNSARMINEDAAQYLEEFPQLLAGDFNANNTTPTIKALKDAGWVDTFEAVHDDQDAGSTFHGFRRSEPDPEAKDTQIDWIFYRGQVQPVAAKVIWDNVDGHFPSDHLFVSADFKL